MDQAFADAGGACATELLPLFSSILAFCSDKRTPDAARVPTITSRQADLSRARDDMKAIADRH